MLCFVCFLNCYIWGAYLGARLLISICTLSVSIFAVGFFPTYSLHFCVRCRFFFSACLKRNWKRNAIRNWLTFELKLRNGGRKRCKTKAKSQAETQIRRRCLSGFKFGDRLTRDAGAEKPPSHFSADMYVCVSEVLRPGRERAPLPLDLARWISVNGEYREARPVGSLWRSMVKS